FGRGCKDTNFSIRERGIFPLSPEKKTSLFSSLLFLQKLHFLIELTFLWSFTGLRSNTFFSAQEKVFLCGAVNARMYTKGTVLFVYMAERGMI
ncbi:MAG: hypothetical protein IK075_10275, partial [Prevotella sp.]|nr:hypothetical protein [Prevotella sp.]